MPFCIRTSRGEVLCAARPAVAGLDLEDDEKLQRAAVPAQKLVNATDVIICL
jgi:hypothetical protein